MSQIIETVDVDVPVRTAYDQWTQFESFPMFMEGVKKVEQLDDTTLHWVAEIAGQKRWKAKITEQAPGPADRLDLDRGRQERRRRHVPPPRRRQDPRHAPARRRSRGPGREHRRRARLRPAAGQGRHGALQGVHRVARHRDGRVARDREAVDRQLTLDRVPRLRTRRTAMARAAGSSSGPDCRPTATRPRRRFARSRSRRR